MGDELNLEGEAGGEVESVGEGEMAEVDLA
jgi:hypothetical protein